MNRHATKERERERKKEKRKDMNKNSVLPSRCCFERKIKRQSHKQNTASPTPKSEKKKIPFHSKHKYIKSKSIKDEWQPF